MPDNPKNPDDDFLPEEGGETRPTPRSSADLSSTRPNTPITTSTQPMQRIPPPPGTGHVRPAPGNLARAQRQRQTPTPPRRRRDPRDSGLYLPVWSLALMLVFVIAAAFGIVALVVGIGGGIAAESDPVFVIITAVPSPTPQSGSVPQDTGTVPQSLPTSTDVPPGAVPTFALEGPTLAPVFLSPTPDIISVGRTVLVVGVNPQELNVRDAPGITDTNIVFRVPDGTRFTVVAGPEFIDGLTWWQLQDITNPSQVGWAAENYLQVMP